MTAKNPIRLNDLIAKTLDSTTVIGVKNPDCAFYNECLSVAAAGNWPGFGCGECKSYEAIGMDQRRSDALALSVIYRAAKNLEETGCVNRRKGVKPGAEAKTRSRSFDIASRMEVNGRDVVALVMA